MIKKYSKKFMQENCGCYSIDHMESIFFKNGNEYITSEDILNSSIPIKDKFWFFCNKANVEKIENKKMAIKIAELVLPIFEKRYTDKDAPRQAINAAKQYLSGHLSLEELNEKRFYASWDAAATDDDDAYNAATTAVAAAAAAADDDGGGG